MSTRKGLLSGFIVCLLGLLSAGAVAAQVCVGFPTAAGQGAVAATAGFPSGASDFGAEASYRMDRPLSIFGGFNLHRPRAGEGTTSYGAGAAFTVPELRAALPIGIFACPTVNLAVTTGTALEENVVAVPVGLGVGTIVGLGPTMSLSPYLVPEFRWTFVGEGSTTNWGLSGGAILLGFMGPRIYAGATFDRIFLEGAQAIFGAKLGFVF